MRWHPQGEVLVSASYDDSIKLWVEEDDEWICAQTLAGVGWLGWMGEWERWPNASWRYEKQASSQAATYCAVHSAGRGGQLAAVLAEHSAGWPALPRLLSRPCRRRPGAQLDSVGGGLRCRRAAHGFLQR